MFLHQPQADVITALRDGVFHTDLVFDQDTRVPARPSDAPAIAVRDGIPISVDEAILDEVGQLASAMFPDGPHADDAPDPEVRAFRLFIDGVSPEDFGATDP